MVCHSLGFSTRIVPHQMRHSYANGMARSGVSFPVLMKILGHVNPEMTMRYVDVALIDLEREFKRAHDKPRHLAPQSKTASSQLRPGLNGLIDALIASQHPLILFRRSLPNLTMGNRLDRLANRLTRVLAEIRKLKST